MERKGRPERTRADYLDDGFEVLADKRPIAPPVGYKRQPSMVEIVRDMVRSEHLRREAEAAGAETFEEADDFEVGDDFDPSSPYENDFDPPIKDLLKAGERSLAEKMEAARGGEGDVDDGRERPAGSRSGKSDQRPDDKSKPFKKSATERGVSGRDSEDSGDDS